MMLKGELLLVEPVPLHRRLSFCFGVLVCLGILMVLDTTFILRANPYHYFIRTVFYSLLGLGVFRLARDLPLEALRRYAKPLFFLALLLMAMVWVPGLGRGAKGAQRWLSLGPIAFQPSEFAKLAYLLYLCDFLARKHDRMSRPGETILPPAILLGAGLGLVLLTRDLGTVVLFGLVAMVVYFLAGVPGRYFLAFLGAGAAGVAGFIASEPYRLVRVRDYLAAFINPFDIQPHEGSYHLVQAITAVGQGGLRGAGPGNAMHKLFFLPEVHTDSVFAHFAESFGLVGSVLFVAVIFTVVILGLKVAERSADRFLSLFMAGLVSMFGLQSFIHIGGNIVLIPMKGITLPFMSYGGSSLVLTLLAAGLMVNIAGRLPASGPRVRHARARAAPPLPRGRRGAGNAC